MRPPLHIALLEQSWRADDNPLLESAYADGVETLVVLSLPAPPTDNAPLAQFIRHEELMASANTCLRQLQALGATALGVQQNHLPDLFKLLSSLRSLRIFREEDPLELYVQDFGATEVRTLPLFTLLHPSDLPIKRTRIPDLFKDFKKQIAPFVLVRRPAPAPTVLPSASEAVREVIKTFRVSFEGAPIQDSPTRLVESWFAEPKRVEKYHFERQKLSGKTTRFSHALSCGSLSQRALWWAAKRFETTRGNNKGSAQLMEQLLRRCFYRLLAVKHERKQVRAEGLLNLPFEWQSAPEYLMAWQNGQTGYPIVDACMRELNTTGELSNRGRRIAASFLTRYLGIDWRKGESYFAERLIDYDPYNNIGNWQVESGVGEDVRQFRFLDVLHQSERFDPEGAYIKRWVPELATLTAGQIHQPWLIDKPTLEAAGLAESVYAEPIIEAESSLKANALRYKAALDRAGLKYPKSLVSRFVRKHEQKRRL